jgi:SAM-dependent methyltransferase
VKTERFFDRQHDDDQLPLPLHFRLLRRFEVSREAVAATLLDGGRALLDIGCGDGALARLVADRYREVCATDVSPSAIAAAEAMPHAPSVRFRTLDASEPLPFADGAFDALVSLSTLQYLFDPEAFLREAHRVLEPGGTLVVEVPNMAYLPQRLRLLAGQPIRTSYWAHGIDGGNLHYFTAGVLSDLVRAAGFEVRAITGSGVLAPLRTFWVSLLCGNVFVQALRR